MSRKTRRRPVPTSWPGRRMKARKNVLNSMRRMVCFWARYFRAQRPDSGSSNANHAFRVQASDAVFGRNQYAQATQFREACKDLAGEALVFVPIHDVGTNLSFCKLADRVPNCFDFLGLAEIHGGLQSQIVWNGMQDERHPESRRIGRNNDWRKADGQAEIGDPHAALGRPLKTGCLACQPRVGRRD